MPETNLEFVPTGAILDELLSRFDHAVFFGRKDKNDKQGTKILRRRYTGDAHVCMGLAADMIDYIAVDIEEDEEDLEPEDT